MNMENIKDYKWCINMTYMTKEQREAVVKFLRSRGYEGHGLDYALMTYTEELTNTTDTGNMQSHVMYSQQFKPEKSVKEIKFSFQTVANPIYPDPAQDRIDELREIIKNAKMELDTLI